jgi:O-acetyl-ADP-ribose deacetylase (regulator of RNase III)
MKVIKGDLLKTELYQIAHGCNAQGVMGSGVAKAIREKWPEAYEFYKNTHDEVGLRLGKTISVPTEDGTKLIHNCITQKYYGKLDKRYVNYAALARCLLTIAKKSITLPERYQKLAIPEIGCGLGGGSKDILLDICSDIEEMCPKFEFVIYSL